MVLRTRLHQAWPEYGYPRYPRETRAKKLAGQLYRRPPPLPGLRVTTLGVLCLRKRRLPGSRSARCDESKLVKEEVMSVLLPLLALGALSPRCFSSRSLRIEPC